jgi:hypothetical protein
MKKNIFTLFCCFFALQSFACCDPSPVLYHAEPLTTNSVFMIYPLHGENFDKYIRYNLYSKTTGKRIPTEIIKTIKPNCGRIQVLFQPTEALILGDSLSFMMTYDTTMTDFQRERDYIKQGIRGELAREYKGYYFSLRYTMKVAKEGQAEFMPKPFYLFYENEYRTQVFKSSAGFHNDIAIQIVSDESVSDATKHHLVEVTIDKKTFYYLSYGNVFILNACGLCGGGGHNLETDTEYTADVRLLLWSGRHSESCKITFRTGIDVYSTGLEQGEKQEAQNRAFEAFMKGRW